MSTVYVIRHAQASMFAEDYDELSALGREQAGALGEALSQRFVVTGEPSPFCALYSGPARRHLDSAALASAAFAAHGGLALPPAKVRAGFDEHDGRGLVLATMAHAARHGGILREQPELATLAAAAADEQLDPQLRAKAWQTLFEAVMRRWLRDELEFEGLESWAAFSARVREAFAALREQAQGRVLLFTSVGPLAAILHELLGLTAERAFASAWRLYNASISRVIYSGARVTLDGFNEVAHLPLDRRTHR